VHQLSKFFRNSYTGLKGETWTETHVVDGETAKSPGLPERATRNSSSLDHRNGLLFSKNQRRINMGSIIQGGAGFIRMRKGYRVSQCWGTTLTIWKIQNTVARLKRYGLVNERSAFEEYIAATRQTAYHWTKKKQTWSKNENKVQTVLLEGAAKNDLTSHGNDQPSALSAHTLTFRSSRVRRKIRAKGTDKEKKQETGKKAS